MIKFRNNINRLEIVLGVALLGTVLVGFTNELYLKNKKIREYTEVASMSCLVPFILLEEYKRLKKQY